jgi:hypothetical protein
MSIIPNNTDPLQDYVAGGPAGSLPALTLNGLVYNKIYAQTGVIDAISTTEKSGYTDPNTNIINGLNNVTVFGQSLETNWISSQDFGGPASPPVVLTYNFSTETDLNIISLEVLNVPCFVELGYMSDATATDEPSMFIPLPGSSSFVLNGGNDIYTTTSFVRLDYLAPETFSLTNLALRITRQNVIQSVNNGILTNIAYSVGVQSFSARLQVLQSTDVPSNVTTPEMGMPAQTINVQNRLGFLENYTYNTYPVSNAFNNDETYWKSSPQPTGDSIVFFYACLNDTSPQTINRLYIDPLYSGCRFNIYFTTESTVSGSIDPGTFMWTPIISDFTLRKGVYEIPDTVATYLKFEFVKLIPEAYDLPLDIVPRIANTFPADIEEYYYALENQIIDGNSVQYSFLGNNNNPQTATTTNINTSTLFGLSSNTIANGNTWPQLSALNNSQLNGNSTTLANNTNSYILDPTISYKLLDSNGDYNGVAYNQFLQRRFPNIQQHNYVQTTINQTWHEAYFTGIQYVTAFYEEQFDDIRITPQSLIPTESDGFVSQNVNYVGMDTDDQAYTQWLPTLETFNSFNIGAIANDWASFITDEQVLMNDASSYASSRLTNCTAMSVGNLGTSSIIQITPNIQGISYGIQSATYASSYNELYYDDANFTHINNWTAGSGTTISGTTLTWVSGGTVSGSAQGLSVSGGSFTATYNFTIPNVQYGGTTPWKLQFGAPGIGTVGFGEYNPLTSGTSYYFYTGLQVSGTYATNIANVNGSISAHTQFYNPVTSGIVAGTVVSGTTMTYVSGTTDRMGYVTATNFSSSGFPSNTIQFVVSGSGVGAYNLYELGVFPTPTTTWVTPQDRNNMRVSGLARIFLPFTNMGTYRVSLRATDRNGNNVTLTFHDFAPMMIPLTTWFDVELTAFTGTNYTNFNVLVEQLNGGVQEIFYVAALSPFYYPIRYEYTTISGSAYPNNYQFITGDINDPNYFVNTTSGIPASGIQLRMTALDPDIFISGISVVPYYKSNPYYAELNIDYIGDSKTNELASRTAVSDKPYFQNSSSIYPQRFTLPIIAGPSTYYVSSQYIYNSI